MLDWKLLSQLINRTNAGQCPDLKGSFEQQVMKDVKELCYGDGQFPGPGLRRTIADLYLGWMDDLADCLEHVKDEPEGDPMLYFRTGERGSIQRFLDKDRYYLTPGDELSGELIAR